MSKKKQTAEEAEQEKTDAAETIEEQKQDPAPEHDTKPGEKAAEEKSDEAKPKTDEAKPKTEEAKPRTDELAAMNDKYLRLCAEYDNFRKRSQKEKDALYDEVKASTLKSFLPVYDNLVRALAQETQDEAYKKGVEMIMAQFRTTMEKLGVSEMDCLGKTFDPAFHNAVMHVEDAEKGENEIVEVFQQGFLLGDRVIRFAMVKVAN
ncbi:MAG: nucleotide exchange factor GrpE [Oscillospiraceae bacterium]|nr:nucleotide exchange factor GrpE [Oscillospiraceae bacterium]